MNKIKSKTYRKILKRKKSRAGGSRIDQSDINAESEGGVDELLEEQVTKRIKERMDLKHGNTGRWARMASKHSRADKSLRYLRVNLRVPRILLNSSSCCWFIADERKT